MRHLYLLLVILICSVTTYAQKGNIEDYTVKVDFHCDHCRKCGSCGERIEKAVYTEKGIKRVEILEQEKKVRIVFNTAKTSEQAIKQAIANAGFDAGDLKANAEAYNKLDDCCKK